ERTFVEIEPAVVGFQRPQLRLAVSLSEGLTYLRPLAACHRHFREPPPTILYRQNRVDLPPCRPLATVSGCASCLTARIVPTATACSCKVSLADRTAKG